MMPDLGKYAVDVLAAYAVTAVILAAIVGLTLAEARRARRLLDDAEKK